MIERLYLILTFFLLFATGLRPCNGQQQNIDSLKTILVNSKVDTNYVNILNDLCFAYKNLYKYEIADSLANVAIEKAQSLKFSHGILRSNLYLAEIQYEKLNYSKSLEIYNNLIQIAGNYANRKYIAICYHRIAQISEDQGKLEESLKYNLLALSIRKEIGDKMGIGYSLGNISSYYINKSDFKSALSYLFEALKIHNELHDNEAIAYTNYNIGKIYFNIKNYSEALRYYDLSKKMTFSLNDLRAYSTVIRSIAEVYQRLGNAEMAMKNFNEALDVATRNNDEITIASTYSGIGTVLQSQKKYSEALANYSKALVSFQKIDYKVGILVTSLNIGETNIKLRNLSIARKFINNGLILCKDIRFKEYSKGAYYNLFEIDSLQNNWESAFNNYKMFIAFRDSLIHESNSKAIDSLRLNYEYTNKSIIEKANHEKETALFIRERKNERNNLAAIIGGLILTSGLGFLNYRSKKRKEKAVLDQRSAELSRQVSEYHIKALRSQMNPHFIFNCVDSIERLLDNAKIEESKISLSNFSSLTRTVLENSMKREISLDEEVDILKIYMDLENVRFKNPFTYNILIQSGVDAKTTLIPPLILQPFIENSIKHGFRDTEKSGHLKIEIWNENEFLICVVEDNGVGRKERLDIKPLSGFKKESMGMRLTGERLQLISEMKNIKSHFLIDDLEDTLNNPKGTRVKVFLPYELSV